MAVRIGVDAMGGDFAPHEIVRGVVGALDLLDPDDRILMYGVRATVEPVMSELGLQDSRVALIDCPQAIGMEESPVDALRQKRDSSIVRMVTAAGKGELDCVISAGNTGAFAAACQLRIKPIPRVSRPGIAVILPTFHGPVVICDVGANVQPKPRQLYEYARMCSAYARAVLKIDDPQVGIVSIGEEAGKGNVLVKEASALLRRDQDVNFIGNVEGRDIFGGKGNVYVTDGFVGNVILKLVEGLAEGLFKTIVREIQEEGPHLAQQFEPIMQRIWSKHDFAEYGGAPLLGINSVVIICHGRSDRRAIRNAIRVARHEVQLNLIGVIADFMAGGLEGSE